MRPLPPIRALEAFVSVAQTGSLSAAATALGMSPPALSRRLRQLEREIGVPLLRRLPRGTVLTSSGERYFKSINPALDAIRIATVDLRSAASRTTIRVSTTPAIARSWLIPRLPALERTQPDVEVDLHLSADLVSLESGEYDVAIRLCEASALSGFHSVLFPITLSSGPRTHSRRRAAASARSASRSADRA
jgi:LysR family transcriptional regulator, glycine cleavage system transcriptional activator